MTRVSRWTGAGLAVLFLALHLPFLPSSLEDLDSVNFALGVRDFDVSRHQPHPPGYPVFIAAAKVFHAVGFSEVHALSLISVLAGALAIVALEWLFGALDRKRAAPDAFTLMAVILVAASPLYWLTSARPLSDLAGLAASLALQGAIVTAAGPAQVMWAAALAGFAAGIRSQVIWLTLPLLVAVAWRIDALKGVVRAAVAYAAGALVWAIPLLIVSGGPAAYARVFFNQGAEDLTGVTLLATRPSVRLLVQTLQHTLIDPWGYWQLGVAVVLLAAAGFVVMVWKREWEPLLLLAIAFAPYIAFDMLFQEAITTRYALPVVIPVVYLAVRATALLPRTPAIAIGLALMLTAVIVDDESLYGYAQRDAPAFRMLADMKDAARGVHETPILALHRRDEYDMRRPFQWVGLQVPSLATRLPSPPKHEWLELVKYWNGGGRAPVWFIADPPRSDLALVRYDGRPVTYRWPFSFTMLVGGARPNETDWHTMETPDWYLGEGWAVTPETAGVAREDHRGPGLGGSRGWVRRWQSPTAILVGGRNFSTAGQSAALRVTFDGVAIENTTVPPGFFLRLIDVPAPASGADYRPIVVESDQSDLAIEQFDAQPAGRAIYGFGDGWNEQEYDPQTGALWRWSTDRATIRVRAEGHGLTLALRGEIEAAPRSQVVIKVDGQMAEQFEIERTFARTVTLPATAFHAGESQITIESSAWYVPADTRWRSKDRRRLGLKLYECRLTAVS